MMISASNGQCTGSLAESAVPKRPSSATCSSRQAAVAGIGYTTSPVAADGKVYFTSEDGHVRVMQAEFPFSWLADNELGDVCLAAPAIADGMIFFRTKSHLTAIGRPN